MVRVGDVWVDPEHVISVGANLGNIVINLSSGVSLRLTGDCSNEAVDNVVRRLFDTPEEWETT